MNAEPAAQQRLLQLADVDAELNRIDHRRRAMPELAEITEAEKILRERKDAVVSAETSARDLDREIARLERDVEGVRARAERDQNLLAGAGLPAKQAADLQHELETLARRQGVLEDEQLEIMEQREAVQTNLDAAQGELAEAERALADAQTRRDGTLADLEAAEAGRRRDREPIVDGLPADLVKLYESIRSRGGPGAAMLRARKCGACRLELDRSEVSQIRAAAPDEVLRHEECGAIMVRTSESGL
ncbi:C4-type zinc ribbon domain-containing protein [Pseudonocardia eucalypti]|uniref:C4-type zinc ribbon domain-containing protein n=1 Tax=Pseudonocardia eucalypti TaxID=648755 RepID=A0ABP9PPK0_9PSEU|nr:putative nucleic acid-binding Zn-ribbon protein [Pseudonocardia eucalypti]